MKPFITLNAEEVREILEALSLCEQVLCEFARTDDGTPSISALHGPQCNHQAGEPVMTNETSFTASGLGH